MKDTEINIAIAKACGAHGWWEGFCFFGKDKRRSPCPDYCADLNAMNEAWCWLLPDQRVQFSNALAWVLFKVHSDPLVEMVFKRDELSIFANATARQRAEAFLRTLGKFKE